MKRGALDVSLLTGAAIAGGLLLAYLTPRAHPAALSNIQVDRQQSVARAHEMSAALGVDPSGWAATVGGDTASNAGFFAQRHPGNKVARRFTPVYPKVAFAAPGKPYRILVRLSAAGDVNAWERIGYEPGAATDVLKARAIAQSALTRVVGPDSAAFRPATDEAQTQRGLLFAWERAGLLTERFEATVQGGDLIKAELKPVYSSDISAALEGRKKYVDVLDGTTALGVYFGGTLFAAIVYLYWAVRRTVKHRFVFAMNAVAVLGPIIAWFNWNQYEEGYSKLASGANPASAWLEAAIPLIFLILFYLVLSGAVDAVGQGAKLATLRSIFRSSALNRRVGFSILAGLLSAPLVSALPLWVSSLHLLGSERTGDYNAGVIYAAYPALQAIQGFVNPAILGLFGFGAGFVARYRKPLLLRILVVLAGILLFGSLTLPSETSFLPYLIKGALMLLIYWGLYLRFDLLTLLSAAWCTGAIWNASTLLVQPARSLEGSGMTVLWFLAAVTVCAALVAWRGREVSMDSLAAVSVVATSQREALMAEFSIAHRVQQEMLPERPPDIPGCTIAASCQPAREVGGDLFDFLKLPDGRWTVGVGDVSGKGVSAALYMTLTKGLLIATTQDSSDLFEIVAHVNRHVHAVTERRTFVTLALGAFDGESRTFDHIRAGHNPIVWRRPSQNATTMLNAPGIGLGIVSDALFRRSTRLSRLQLDSGDLLVFYSDGLTEAMDSAQEQFGEDRLMRALEHADGLEAVAVRDHILGEVKAFLKGVAPQDDMTIVVLRVN